MEMGATTQTADVDAIQQLTTAKLAGAPKPLCLSQVHLSTMVELM